MPLHAFLKPIADQPHFCYWRARAVQGRKSGVAKVPMKVDAPGTASVDSAEGFGTYKAARSAFREAKRGCEAQGVEWRGGGVGIRLTDLPRLVVVDLDRVIEDGKLMPEWRKLLGVANTFVEVSQSGNGLHLFFWLTRDHVINRNLGADARGGRAEVYSHCPRFIALGKHMPGTPLEPRLITLDRLHAHFPKLAESTAPRAIVRRPTVAASPRLAMRLARYARASGPDRSRTFAVATTMMMEAGATMEQAVAAFEAAPRGSACDKYRDDGRLAAEVERLWGKP